MADAPPAPPVTEEPPPPPLPPPSSSSSPTAAAAAASVLPPPGPPTNPATSPRNGSSSSSQSPSLFSTEFRKDFQDWMMKHHPVTEKSAREYMYQLADLTREVVKEKGLEPAPVSMEKAAVKAFVMEHLDMYTELARKRKKQRKKLPVLSHLKDYLSLKTLSLPARNDRSVIDPELKREFVTWLSKDRHVAEGKNAVKYHYALVELVNGLLKRLGKTIDINQTRLDKEQIKQLIEDHPDDVAALIQQRHEEKKKTKGMSFLNYVKVFFGLHSLVLPNWSDRSLINPKLKKDFMKWLQEERCLTDTTMKQYYREVTRMVRLIFLNYRELGGEGGTCQRQPIHFFNVYKSCLFFLS